MNELRIIYTTIDDSIKAKKLAKDLIKGGLVACVNIIPGMISVYEWEGRVEEESECLLIIKTLASKVNDLQTKLLELHHYELPEFIVLNPADVSRDYHSWIIGQV
jgi:periplasmic divalent cation tolerance protein